MHYWTGYSCGVGVLIGQPTVFEYSQKSCDVTCIVTGEEWKQNTYIIFERSTANTIIVDPGDNADLIITHIQDRAGKVNHILLTHPHHDHVGAVMRVSEFFNVECELHRLDVRLLMHAPMYALRFANKKMAPVSRFQYFDELCLETELPALCSIHTPGHTKGSVCYIFDDFVLTGDTLLYKHIGRTDLPGSDREAISLSVEKLLWNLSDDLTIFSGHGKPWSIGAAKEWWQEIQAVAPEHRTFVDEIS